MLHCPPVQHYPNLPQVYNLHSIVVAVHMEEWSMRTSQAFSHENHDQNIYARKQNLHDFWVLGLCHAHVNTLAIS